MADPGITRVFVVDEHPIVREGLKALLSSCSDVVVVGGADTAQDAAAQLPFTPADVVLFDLDGAGELHLGLVAELKHAAPAARFLAFTESREVSRHRGALLAGAHGVISKKEHPEVLLKAIHALHAGELWFERGVLGAALDEALEVVRRHDPEQARIASLTAREREVTALVGEGLRNEEIGHRLSICEKTVRNHVVDVCRKLRVSGRLELLVYANRHGLGRLATDER